MADLVLMDLQKMTRLIDKKLKLSCLTDKNDLIKLQKLFWLIDKTWPDWLAKNGLIAPGEPRTPDLRISQ